MSTGNTLLIFNSYNKSSSNGGGFEPKWWWILIIAIILTIKWIFLDNLNFL